MVGTEQNINIKNINDRKKLVESESETFKRPLFLQKIFGIFSFCCDHCVNLIMHYKVLSFFFIICVYLCVDECVCVCVCKVLCIFNVIMFWTRNSNIEFLDFAPSSNHMPLPLAFAMLLLFFSFLISVASLLMHAHMSTEFHQDLQIRVVCIFDAMFIECSRV